MLKFIIALLQLFLFHADFNFEENTSLYNETLKKEYGTVYTQLYEGYAYENDVYVITLETGEMITVECDDLNPGNPVTVYYVANIPVRVLYDYR